jgi:hypothetical protein
MSRVPGNRLNPNFAAHSRLSVYVDNVKAQAVTTADRIQPEPDPEASIDVDVTSDDGATTPGGQVMATAVAVIFALIIWRRARRRRLR